MNYDMYILTNEERRKGGQEGKKKGGEEGRSDGGLEEGGHPIPVSANRESLL